MSVVVPHSVPQHYSPPFLWGVSFTWATGVRHDTQSLLLLYMLWKCEQGSVVVVCLAWGLACPSIHSLHEHWCCSLSRGVCHLQPHFEMSMGMLVVFLLFVLDGIFIVGGGLAKFSTHLLPHSRILRPLIGT